MNRSSIAADSTASCLRCARLYRFYRDRAAEPRYRVRGDDRRAKHWLRALVREFPMGALDLGWSPREWVSDAEAEELGTPEQVAKWERDHAALQARKRSRAVQRARFRSGAMTLREHLRYREEVIKEHDSFACHGSRQQSNLRPAEGSHAARSCRSRSSHKARSTKGAASKGDPDPSGDGEPAGHQPQASGRDGNSGDEDDEDGLAELDVLMRAAPSGAASMPKQALGHRSTSGGLHTQNKPTKPRVREVRACARCGAHLRSDNALSICEPCIESGASLEAVAEIRRCGCGCGTPLPVGMRSDADFLNRSHSKNYRRRLQRERQQAGMAVAA